MTSLAITALTTLSAAADGAAVTASPTAHCNTMRPVDVEVCFTRQTIDEQLLTGDSRIMIGMPFRPNDPMTFGMSDVLE